MRARVIIGAVAATIALAGPALAQGKGNGKAKHANKGEVVRTSNGDVIVVPGNGRKVPPGLAKKPGQMPPGQYKKIYGVGDGASVLSDILRRRGLPVTRLVTSGDSRVVYFRDSDGRIRRAVVSPGADRLRFSNVPAAILQEVLARLY